MRHIGFVRSDYSNIRYSSTERALSGEPEQSPCSLHAFLCFASTRCRVGCWQTTSPSRVVPCGFTFAWSLSPDSDQHSSARTRRTQIIACIIPVHAYTHTHNNPCHCFLHRQRRGRCIPPTHPAKPSPDVPQLPVKQYPNQNAMYRHLRRQAFRQKIHI